MPTNYKEALRRLAHQGVLGTSSGTLPGARKVAPGGRIVRWPIVEGSATVAPADPRQLERHFAAIGLAFGPAAQRRAKLGLLSLLELEVELYL